MATRPHKYKSEFLGMNVGTAMYRLRKIILFELVKQTGQDTCFRCGEKITTIRQFSIDHKKPWLDNAPALFWDLSNIAFSHLSCNASAARQGTKRHDPSKQGQKGEVHHSAILTTNKVRSIRTEYNTGTISLRKLGNKYGVSATTIWDIVHRRKWKHIP